MNSIYDQATILHRLRQLDRARLYLCRIPVYDYGEHSLALHYVNEEIDRMEQEYRLLTGDRIDIVDYRSCEHPFERQQRHLREASGLE